MHKLHGLLSQKIIISHNDLAQRLKMSRSSLFELIAYLRDEMQAPILYNTERSSYEYVYPTRFNLDCFNNRSKPEDPDYKNEREIPGEQNFSFEEDNPDFEASDDELEDVCVNSDDEEWYNESSVVNLSNEATSTRLCNDSYGGKKNEALKAFLNDTEACDFVLDADIHFNDLFYDWE